MQSEPILRPHCIVHSATVDTVIIFMESIITLFKAHIEEDHDAGCHTDGKAQYVDNGELPYLQKVPEGGLR